jgi:hypothetical protein
MFGIGKIHQAGQFGYFTEDLFHTRHIGSLRMSCRASLYDIFPSDLKSFLTQSLLF